MIPQQTYDATRPDLRRIILTPYSGEKGKAMMDSAQTAANSIMAETAHAGREEFTFLVTSTNNANRYADAISNILPKTLFTQRDIRLTPYFLRGEDLSDVCKGIDVASEKVFFNFDLPCTQTKPVESAYYDGQTNLIVIARPYVLEQIGLSILQQFGNLGQNNQAVKSVYTQPVSLVVDPTKKLQTE